MTIKSCSHKKIAKSISIYQLKLQAHFPSFGAPESCKAQTARLVVKEAANIEVMYFIQVPGKKLHFLRVKNSVPS